MSIPRRLFENQRVITGEWWLPKASRRKFRGDLEWITNQTQFSLRLHAKNSSRLLDRDPYPERICGVLHNGLRVTLLNNYLHLSEYGGSGQDVFNYLSSGLIAGKKNIHKTPIRATEVVVLLENLDHWFNNSRPHVVNTTSSVRVLYKASKPYDCAYKKSDLSIKFRTFPTYRQTGGKISLKSSVFLHVSCRSRAQSTDSWESHVFRIVNIIELFSSSRPKISNISLTNRNGDDLGDIFRPSWELEQKPNRVSMHSGFSFMNCRKSLRKAFQKNERDPEISKIISLFLETVKSPEMTVETKFLLLCQIFEWFHRIRLPVEYISKKKYSSSTKSVFLEVQKINHPELRQKLCGLLEFGFEVSFRRQLKDLAKEITPFDRNVSATMKDLIQSVVNQRNFLVHRNPMASPAAKNIEEIIENYHRLEAWLILLLLKDLGFTSAMLEILVSRSHKFQYGIPRAI